MNKGLRCEKPQSFLNSTNQAPQPINDRVKGDCSSSEQTLYIFCRTCTSDKSNATDRSSSP
uniref:Uncharacterized protein n=1 Tax=Anguilla anguilla TaxID=7936 RepID=A0A0E9WM19_ANGAN